MAARIDVHHHFIPEFYAEAVTKAGGDPSGWKLPTWTIESDGSFNNSHQIKTSILSLTTPGPMLFGVAESVKVARHANEAAALIRDKEPKKYGFFASVPSLINQAAALEEIAYALDILKADGVCLFTRYERKYLGHPDFSAIWDELDRRHAVVFIHPTHSFDASLVNPMLPQPVIDFPHETTRTAVDLIVSNTIRTHSRCKIILSHAGGTLPYIAGRPAAMMPYLPAETGKSPEEFMEDAKSFYFDLALSGNEHTYSLLTAFAKPGHILYGSDYPYAPTPTITEFTNAIDTFNTDKEVASAINRENALELFPRLSK